MSKLLSLYSSEPPRLAVEVSGSPVPPALLSSLSTLLEEWSASWTFSNSERTSISAENYMILTRPSSHPAGSRGRAKAEAKLGEQ